MISDIAKSPDDIKVWKVFKYCEDAFGKMGINVAFPKHTDPKKTYKWRYLVKFVEKLDELNASNETAMLLVRAVAKYADVHKQRHKGLSLLMSDKVLEACCVSIEKDNASDYKLLERIEVDNTLVCGNDLMHKSNKRGLPDIIRWHMQGSISEVYMALSRRCYEAMLKLDKIERSMLPSGKELIAARAKLFRSVRLKHQAKLAMGDDWRDVFN